MTQAQEVTEPLVLGGERWEYLRGVGGRVALGQKRLEPGSTAAAELGLFLEPHEGDENRLAETAGQATGNPLGRKKRRYRKDDAADEHRGVPPTEASV